jgi:mannose-6-phosphate isomerase-like protein (cupin superfamily)
MPSTLNLSIFIIWISSILLFLPASSLDAGHRIQSKAIPKIVKLDPKTDDYQRILGGPPETVTMHSGLVVLAPGKSVGVHNTEKYEEVLVILEGRGEMRITGGAAMDLRVNTLAYCPPRTEHNVVNTGKGRLRYLYVVAIAEK